jgi:serralysin
MASAEIAGTLTGTVLEDAIFRTYGEVFISSDSLDGRFLAGTFDGLYGALTLTATGGWSYAMNNDLATVQSLAAATDSHDYFVLNWAGGLVQGLLDIVVQGANDPAAFDGDLAGTLDASRASSLSGKIEIRDPDTGEKEMQPLVAQQGEAGTLTLTKDGNWTYELLPGQDTAIIDQQKPVTDIFTVSAKDLTTTILTITVRPTAAPEIVLGTEDDDPLSGSPGDDQIRGAGGNDTLNGGQGNDLLDGGAGLDEAHFTSMRAASTISRQGGEILITGPEGSDTLRDVERAIFSDGALGFDIEGTGGKAYRLYQTAFDRVPDEGGVGYWIHLIDRGFISLEGAAAEFIASEEFQGLYGTDPTPDEFLSLLYRNTMNREPDDAGKLYWLDALNGEGLFAGTPCSKASVLLQFSESRENQDNVIGVISDGFEYLPWAG